MYYAHFGLNEPPFKITPNTEIFFTGSNRGAVLDALMYAVTSGEGIVKVVGEVGSGKTMLCRMLQAMLPDTVECIYLANPSVAPEDILHAIAFELDLKLPKNPDKLIVMQALQSYLLDRHEAGKQVVIFVEEAQGMPLATLEEIRLLSNLETKHDKLLQMVLFGQPELDANLNQTHIRQLRERITHSFYLTPLQEHEVGEYLIFRLRSSGYYGPHLFTDKSIAKITKSAEGLIRRVNILADKALLAAYAEGVYQVTPKHVNAAIRDSEFGAEKTKVSKQKVKIFAVIGTLLVAGLIAGSIWLLQTQPELRAQLASQWHWMKAKVGLDVTQSNQADNATPQVVEQEDVRAPKAQPSVAPAAADNAGSVDAGSDAQVNEASNDEDAESDVLGFDIDAPSNDEAVDDSPSLPDDESEPLMSPPTQPLPDVLQSRVTSTELWMSRYSDHTVTIQILGSADVDGLTEQIGLLSRVIELDEIFVYETTVNEQPYYTVLYGSFENRVLANEALNKLPLRIQKNRPHLRTIGGILAETNKSL